MRIKVLMITLFLSLITGRMDLLIAQESKASPDLQILIDEALLNNPDYRSLEKQWQAAQTRISQQGALPDPRLGLGVMNLPVNSFDFDQEPMTSKKVSIMQMFPFPGKLGLKETIAEFQAEIVKQQKEELKNQLVKNVKTAYYNLFFIDKSIDIVKKNQVLLKQFVRVAETKYSVGKGLQQDVLKAQVERSKLSDKILLLEQKRKTIIFRLNTLLNRNSDEPMGKIKDFEKSSFVATLDELKKAALKNRPVLNSWQLMIEKSKSAEKLARKGYLPDFSLGAAYSQRDDLRSGAKMYDFFSAELSLNLPIYFYKKQSQKVQERQLLTMSNEEKYNTVKNRVLFQVENNWSELTKDEQRIDLYKTGIIPLAGQSLNSAMTGYQVDKVDFLTLLNNQMTLFNFEMDYYRILADYQKTLAALEAAVGIVFK